MNKEQKLKELEENKTELRKKYDTLSKDKFKCHSPERWEVQEKLFKLNLEIEKLRDEKK